MCCLQEELFYRSRVQSKAVGDSGSFSCSRYLGHKDVQELHEVDQEMGAEKESEIMSEQVASEELLAALEKLFSLPNWENRVSGWRDINDAMEIVYQAYVEMKSSEK